MMDDAPPSRMTGRRRKQYRRNRDQSKDKESKRRSAAKARAAIAKFKDVPCADCGGRFHPVCMDFDHRPGETKIKNVAAMLPWGWKAVVAEIAKCDVVCANCHRLRSYRQRNHGNLVKKVRWGIDTPEPTQVELPGVSS